MMETSVIQSLLPPLVMISANGLLCLGQFARYTAIVGRIRALHRERLDLCIRLQGLADSGPEQSLIARRADHLESQAHQMLGHARLIRAALHLLVGAIILFLLCSLLIGLEQVLPPICHVASVAAFVLGLVCMLAGMVLVLAEVRRSLDIVIDEHAQLESLCEESSPTHTRGTL